MLLHDSWGRIISLRNGAFYKYVLDPEKWCMTLLWNAFYPTVRLGGQFTTLDCSQNHSEGLA